MKNTNYQKKKVPKLIERRLSEIYTQCEKNKEEEDANETFQTALNHRIGISFWLLPTAQKKTLLYII